MPATPTVVLGRLRRAAASAPWPGHVLLYLPAAEMVVMPITQIPGGWRCAMVATRTACPTGQVTLTNTDLAAATARISVDPQRDPEGYARLLWLTRVFAQWPSGPILALARHLADQPRTPGTIVIPGRQIADIARIASERRYSKTYTAEHLLAALTNAGFLTRVTTRWQLTALPDES